MTVFASCFAFLFALPILIPVFLGVLVCFIVGLFTPPSD